MRDLHTGERRVFDKHISDNPVWHVKWKPFSIYLKSITCNTLLPVHCWKWKWPKRGLAWTPLTRNSGFFLEPFFPRTFLSFEPFFLLWLFLPLAWNQNILTTVYGTFLLNLKYLKLSYFEITLRLFRLFRSFYFLNIIAKEK